jgi:2-oxoglutarate ferredoxin oxidoreductase subunit gamma
VSRLEVRLAGFGGQGMILASYIIGKAAALYDNKKSTHTQSYGPEARGGACTAGVIISDESIDYPFVQIPDFLILMSQEAYNVHIRQCAKETLVLIDEDLVELHDDAKELKVLKIPATRIAEELEKRIVANIVMLGYFISISGIVQKNSMIKSIETSVPPPTKELNVEAFNRGFAFGEASKSAAIR